MMALVVGDNHYTSNLCKLLVGSEWTSASVGTVAESENRRPHARLVHILERKCRVLDS